MLDRSFSAALLGNAEEQLRLVIYGLMGVTEERGAGLEFPDDLPEPRLTRPDSGLYAWVEDAAGAIVWRSPSERLSGRAQDTFPVEAAPGTFVFAEHEQQFHIAYTVIWEAARDAQFTFRVVADKEPFLVAASGFRRSLVAGSLAVIVLIVLAQYLAVSWGLKPLDDMAQRIRELEAGARTRLGEDYPPELAGLARNLDRFVVHEAESRDRYRRAMDDLAHSLKTPLAVLRNALTEQTQDRGLLEDQLDRMESTVRQQLSRAMAARPRLLAPPTRLAPLLDRLLRALETAYAEKGVWVERRVDDALRVKLDEVDLMEILGNVLDNAFKYSRSRVDVSARAEPDGPVHLVVEDDGAGIDPALRDDVLGRGVRADTVMPGQGIGLAVVVDLLASYGGRMTIGDAGLGGASVCLELPRARHQ